jgi:dUTP pyrophosphatase
VHLESDILIPIKRIAGSEDIALPAYQSVGAAGMDVRAAVKSPIQLEPGKIALVPSGFAIALPLGCEAQIRPRSGLATKYGVTLVNSPGTIDADYRGEVGVALINLGTEVFEITRGLRIAQMVIARVGRAQWNEVKDLPSTSRDSGGFGHTGT